MCLSGILYLKKNLIKRTIRLFHSLYVEKERNADKKSGKERNKAKLISNALKFIFRRVLM
jgi:hypothetical protein